ncbi:MAG: amidohydrolase, partial [archaeon]|nr:amidohydrolase [archaeon]
MKKQNKAIYFNGNIVTVDDNKPKVEAFVIEGKNIIFTGSKEDAFKLKNEDTKVIDLDGKTVLPGFIDAHSHFFIGTLTGSLAVNLSAPPVGKIETIDDIINALKEEIKNKKIKPGKSVMGMGYDESLLKDKRIPTRDDLDKISTEHKISIVHQSGHVAVVNSLILEKFGIDENTEDPEGGVFVRYEGTRRPNGICEEKAFMTMQMKLFPLPKIWKIKQIFNKGQEIYTSNGITTAQDGGVVKLLVIVFKILDFLKLLKVDVVGYYMAQSKEDVQNYVKKNKKGKSEETEETKETKETKKRKKKRRRFNLAGIKVLLDGSPQAKTAWLSKPYYKIPEGKPDDYKGYPLFEDENVVQDIFDEVVKNKLQVLTHTNGDEACEQLIRVYEKAQQKTGVKANLRPVMIHAQTVREDQLDRMKNLQMIPSFYQMHTYFWGDWHLDSVLGPERGARISPVASTIKREMPFTVHCDTPVLPPLTPYMLWTAVNRKTRSGRIIGEDQKIG